MSFLFSMWLQREQENKFLCQQAKIEQMANLASIPALLHCLGSN